MLPSFMCCWVILLHKDELLCLTQPQPVLVGYECQALTALIALCSASSHTLTRARALCVSLQAHCPP
jgi:hypothetical protein